MNASTLIHVLRASGDPSRAEAMAAYMRKRFVFLGVGTPERRRLTRPFFRAEKGRPLDWAFVEDCWACPYRELQYVATDYLRSGAAALTAADLPRLRSLIGRKSWWDSVDGFIRPLGELLRRRPEVRPEIIQMGRAADFWLRRAAITAQLLAGAATDRELLATVLTDNLGSTEFFVNKAIGWALRQYSKTDADWVRRYLAEHAEGLSALSRREASKYLH